MFKIKKKFAAATAVAAALLVAGCGGPNRVSGQVQGVNVTMPDGRVVPCVVFDGNSYAGGLSCDWSAR